MIRTPVWYMRTYKILESIPLLLQFIVLNCCWSTIECSQSVLAKGKLYAILQTHSTNTVGGQGWQGQSRWSAVAALASSVRQTARCPVYWASLCWNVDWWPSPLQNRARMVHPLNSSICNVAPIFLARTIVIPHQHSSCAVLIVTSELSRCLCHYKIL